jgi:dihydropteroate synthase
VGVLRLGRRVFEPDQLLVMAIVSPGDPAAAMERVHAAVAGGGDGVEVSAGTGGEAGRIVPFIATVRELYPELVIGVSTGREEVAREACAAGADLLDGPGLRVAAEFGVGVICPPGLAARAVEAGVEPERIIVGSEGVRELEELTAIGWPVLVSPSSAAGAGGLAVAAVAAWLGARVFRVDEVRETRRALRMVSAIRGDMPPAYAVRGLA